ncbi:MAG: hypothetical protein WCY11_07215 [Novosphingobium sp.]
MSYALSRPAADFAAGRGLLVLEHFQMAYVTNDSDHACALLRDRLGVREFRTLEGQMPAGGHIRADFAWVGTTMYEIISASGPGSALYMDRLPVTQDFVMQHHHLGFLIHDQAQWDGVLAHAEKHGFTIPFRNVNPLVEVCFVDVPELGHYLEYLFATPLGLEFFESVPRT